MHIILVSHYYEPFDLVGAKRSTYFANYLKSHGHKITVLKADNRFYGNNMTSINDVQHNILNISIDSVADIYTTRDNEKWKAAYWHALSELCGSFSVDLIIFSGGPFFYFPLGADVFKKYGINYLLDFRDPWYLDPRLDKSISVIRGRLALRKIVSNYILWKRESRSVKYAKYVINVTPSLTTMYKDYYSKEDSRKFITIINGYDESQLEGLLENEKIPEKDNKTTLKIGIFGKFGYYNKEDVNTLISSIRVLLSKGIQVKLYYCGEDYQSFLSEKKSTLEENIIINKNVEYMQGMKIMSGMDCFVLNNRDLLSRGTKVYDYIFLNKPMIAFIDTRSELGKFVSSFQNGFILRSEKEFVRVIELIKEKNLSVLSEKLNCEDYSRHSSSKSLLECLKI